jgi:hypothetical protein
MADLDAELALFQAELGALTDDTPAEAPTQPAVRASFVAQGRCGEAGQWGPVWAETT